jgi:hypothetical protein
MVDLELTVVIVYQEKEPQFNYLTGRPKNARLKTARREKG